MVNYDLPTNQLKLLFVGKCTFLAPSKTLLSTGQGVILSIFGVQSMWVSEVLHSSASFIRLLHLELLQSLFSMKGCRRKAMVSCLALTCGIEGDELNSFHGEDSLVGIPIFPRGNEAADQTVEGCK